MKPKILFWSIYLDVIMTGRKPPVAIGGADIQLAQWARCFSLNGWKTFSFSYRFGSLKTTLSGTAFLYVPFVRKLMFLLQYLKFIWIIIIRPDAVVVRDGGKDLQLLTLVSRVLHFKLVYMIASDLEFSPDSSGRNGNRQKRILKLAHVVAQNSYQKECFQSIKGMEMELPVVPNIWYPGFLTSGVQSPNKQYDIVWIGNLRSVKRPEWILEIARDLPQVRVAMVGAPLNQDLFRRCIRSMKELDNITYLKYLSFQEVSGILAQSRLLVSTSLAEGFPNTFLQAWEMGIPIVSTVNPGNVFTRHRVGIYAASYEEVVRAINRLLEHPSEYDSLAAYIPGYLAMMHDPQSNYQLLFRSLQFPDNH